MVTWSLWKRCPPRARPLCDVAVEFGRGLFVEGYPNIVYETEQGDILLDPLVFAGQFHAGGEAA